MGRKLYDDAMFKLEHGEQDKDKGKSSEQNLKRLSALQNRVKDDYMANRILRDEMRAKRKVAKATKAADDALRKKASLDIDLLPESKADVEMAALMRLQPSESSEERQQTSRETIAEESIFSPSTSGANPAATPSSTPSSSSSSTSTPISAKERSRQNIQSMVQRHRLKSKQAGLANQRSLGIVLKRPASKEPSQIQDEEQAKKEKKEKGTNSEASPSSEHMSSQPTSEQTENDSLTTQQPLLCDYGSTSSDSD